MAIVRLGDVCDIFIGKTPSTKNNDYWSSNDIKFLNGSLNDYRYISKYALEKCNMKLTKKNKGFLMSILGNLYFKFSDDEYSFNQQVAYISVLDKGILPKYLFYKFINDESLIKNYMFGTTVKHLNKRIIENIDTQIPSINNQQKIIDIIEPKEYLYKKYSNLINIDNYDSLIKSWNILIDIIEPFEKNKQVN